MIHIVFQHSDIDTLQEAIKLDPSLQGEIIQIADDFAVGPVQHIFSDEGIEARKQWWREVLAGGDYDGIVDDGSVPDDRKTVQSLIERLQSDESETIWIWAAQNKHDVSGYYWLVSQLKNFQGRVFILYLNNLPFINEKGQLFYPTNLFDIPPKEFIKAKILVRPVTLSEFEIDPDEWTRICNEAKGVRILEGGKKLAQFDYDYYDESLQKFISGDWQKGNRIIHQFLAKSKEITGDAYLLWRLKNILAQGTFDVQGELKNMKDFEVKLKASQPATDSLAV
ncbi:MAG: hypothetical protein C5B59_03305 [Bacteroidetes bacterium]|nr:MAG: hypothetical protein C5B59_03305 [Bacteroidota bacterium]